MIEFCYTLLDKTWAATDAHVESMQNWFEAVFEKPLHEFCDKHQLHYNSWTKSFTDRNGRLASPSSVEDPELKNQLLVLSSLLDFTLSKEDRLGDVLASYCPWEKS